MIPFQERKKIRKILYSRVTLTLLAVAVFVVAKGAWGVHQKAKIAISERDITQHSLDELNNHIQELQVSLEHFKSNKGMEEELRQKYTVARAGEDVVVVVDDSQKKSENNEAIDSESLWQSFVSFFGF